MTDDTEQLLNEHKAALRYMLNAARRYLHEPRHSTEHLADLLRAVNQAERTLKLPEDIWLKDDRK